MDVVFGLIPAMLLVGFLAVVVFIIMGKTGQFDDLDGAANSIFMDDEYEEDERTAQKEAQQQVEQQDKNS
ncbi:cbb3-type cytochrome oxidase assembly protein CcoS [Hydrogenovibrio kuenenii]|uniref:cbb3-type cytochrome oxidase assembly protein CcoS n=1 Tax=Hydrogenovibrio kuenenii TaxID=63658 RepID=UPI0004674932|nr:cbb3-type cytochrome oxidase assembly protein CcoS [Hydrogenovibrio kuenenii]